MITFDVLCGEAYEVLCAMPPRIAQCCVTSVPYWFLRDYKQPRQIGLEPLPEYLAKLGSVFDEVRRVLRDDGTLWLNVGDSYIGSGKGATGSSSTITNPRRYEEAGFPLARTRTTEGLKLKDIAGVPWRLAFELQRRGWWLRGDNIWHKTNGLPEPVVDRPGRAHEYVFLLAKSYSYFYDAEAVKQPSAETAHPRRAFRAPEMQSAFELTFDENDQITYESTDKNESTAAAAAYINDAKHRRVAGFNDRYKKTEAIAAAEAAMKPDHRTADFNVRWNESERLTKGKSNDNFQASVADVVRMVNLRSVWSFPTIPSTEEHYAMFPPELPRRCILASSKPGDLVLDCFSGMATTGVVALELGRSYLGVELDPVAVARSKRRCAAVTPPHPLLVGGV